MPPAAAATATAAGQWCGPCARAWPDFRPAAAINAPSSIQRFTDVSRPGINARHSAASCPSAGASSNRGSGRAASSPFAACRVRLGLNSGSAMGRFATHLGCSRPAPFRARNFLGIFFTVRLAKSRRWRGTPCESKSTDCARHRRPPRLPEAARGSGSGRDVDEICLG